MPINLEIEIFIFLVRYVIVVLLVIVAFTCDKLFPHYMCLTLITIYCLAVAAQSVGPDAHHRGQTPAPGPDARTGARRPPPGPDARTGARRPRRIRATRHRATKEEATAPR